MERLVLVLALALVLVLVLVLVLAASAPAQGRCLVVVLSETRAHELTWPTFERNVLRRLDADLALCVSTRCAYDKATDPFFQNAKYTWSMDEPDDWGVVYDDAQRHLGCAGRWRAILEVKDQLFGGIKDPEHEHPGSAGIGLAFRWILLTRLVSSGALDAYTHFVITRSDHYYELPHPLIDFADKDTILIPEGEDYGGVTDRHVVVPRRHVVALLDVMRELLCRPEQMRAELSAISTAWNPEQYLLYHYKKRGIAQFIRRFERVMYTVRLEGGSTRWSVGAYNPEAGMIVKYEGEYEAVQRAKRAVYVP